MTAAPWHRARWEPFLASEDAIGQAMQVKELLVQTARDCLPRGMGDRYTRIVVNYLTCLDEDNADFGNASKFEDADGVLVGVRHIEKVRFA